MDIFFHGCAGALLASRLGERRGRYVFAGAVVGMIPDLALGISWGFHRSVSYGLTHSPIYNGILLGLLLLVNWRVALALPLHILVDAPLHKYSGLYDLLHVRGINWYEGPGRIVWPFLWLALIALAVLHLRSLRRRPQPAAQTAR
jgi:hypothetical protein